MPAPSGKTTKNSFPYPLETDGADPARDLKALAEALDAVINTAAIMPIGAEAEYAGENDPSATWLVEDGRAISRTTYATLFGIIGTKYGAGDGSATFNLPDTRGRISVGAGTGPGLTARALASTTGKEKVKLGIAEIPVHKHNVVDPGHSHGASTSDKAENGSGAYIFIPPAGWGGQLGHVLEGGGTGGNFNVAGAPGGGIKTTIAAASTGVSTANEGTGNEHENMPPVIAKNKIIRVL